MNVSNLSSQQLELLALPIEKNHLIDFQNLMLGKNKSTVLNRIKFIFNQGSLEAEQFKQLKEKIIAHYATPRSLIHKLTYKATRHIFPQITHSTDCIFKIIQEKRRAFLQKERFTSFQELASVLILLENNYPLDLDLAKKIISSLETLNELGYYSQEEHFHHYHLKDSEVQLIKKFQEQFKNALLKTTNPEVKAELRSMTLKLKNCLLCADIGINPQLLLKEQFPYTISQFLFDKKAIHQLKYFNTKIEYKFKDEQLVPYCVFNPGNKPQDTLCMSLEELSRLGLEKDINEWKILKDGFKERSAYYWNKLEPIAQIENWQGGFVVEMSTYLSNDLMGVAAGSHSAIRFINNEGKVYSIGIAGDSLGGIARLASPDWMFFFPHTLQQEIVSRYSLSENAFKTLIQDIEKTQIMRVEFLELERKKNVANDRLNDALRDLKIAQTILDKVIKQNDLNEISKAQSNVLNQEANLKARQITFDQALANFHAFINDDNENETRLDLYYFRFGNNCASLAQTILQKADQLGAIPTPIEPSELRKGQKTSLNIIWKVALKINSLVIKLLGYISIYLEYYINKDYENPVKLMIKNSKHRIILPNDIALKSLFDNERAIKIPKKSLSGRLKLNPANG